MARSILQWMHPLSTRPISTLTMFTIPMRPISLGIRLQQARLQTVDLRGHRYSSSRQSLLHYVAPKPVVIPNVTHCTLAVTPRFTSLLSSPPALSLYQTPHTEIQQLKVLTSFGSGQHFHKRSFSTDPGFRLSHQNVKPRSSNTTGRPRSQPPQRSPTSNQQESSTSRIYEWRIVQAARQVILVMRALSTRPYLGMSVEQQTLRERWRANLRFIGLVILLLSLGAMWPRFVMAENRVSVVRSAALAENDPYHEVRENWRQKKNVRRVVAVNRDESSGDLRELMTDDGWWYKVRNIVWRNGAFWVRELDGGRLVRLVGFDDLANRGIIEGREVMDLGKNLKKRPRVDYPGMEIQEMERGDRKGQN